MCVKHPPVVLNISVIDSFVNFRLFICLCVKWSNGLVCFKWCGTSNLYILLKIYISHYIHQNRVNPNNMGLQHIKIGSFSKFKVSSFFPFFFVFLESKYALEICLIQNQITIYRIRILYRILLLRISPGYNSSNRRRHTK